MQWQSASLGFGLVCTIGCDFLYINHWSCMSFALQYTKYPRKHSGASNVGPCLLLASLLCECLLLKCSQSWRDLTLNGNAANRSTLCKLALGQAPGAVKKGKARSNYKFLSVWGLVCTIGYNLLYIHQSLVLHFAPALCTKCEVCKSMQPYSGARTSQCNIVQYSKAQLHWAWVNKSYIKPKCCGGCWGNNWLLQLVINQTFGMLHSFPQVDNKVENRHK